MQTLCRSGEQPSGVEHRAGQFGDIPASDPGYQVITFLAALGIVNPNGVNGSGNFQPGTAVKRAEVATFAARTFG